MDTTPAEPTGSLRPSSPSRPYLRRPALDRPQVVAAATVVLERVGFARFTMREVGAELDVRAMALYHYIDGRDDLLGGVAAHLVDQLFSTPRPVDPPQWQPYLTRLARDVWRVAGDHPETTVLLLTSRPTTAGVRTPFRTPRTVETCLQDLQRCGLSDAAVAAAYQEFCRLVVRQLVTDLGNPQDVTVPGSHTYPLLARIAPTLSDLAISQHDQQPGNHHDPTLPGRDRHGPVQDADRASAGWRVRDR